MTHLVNSATEKLPTVFHGMHDPAGSSLHMWTIPNVGKNFESKQNRFIRPLILSSTHFVYHLPFVIHKPLPKNSNPPFDLQHLQIPPLYISILA